MRIRCAPSVHGAGRPPFMHPFALFPITRLALRPSTGRHAAWHPLRQIPPARRRMIWNCTYAKFYDYESNLKFRRFYQTLLFSYVAIEVRRPVVRSQSSPPPLPAYPFLLTNERPAGASSSSVRTSVVIADRSVGRTDGYGRCTHTCPPPPPPPLPKEYMRETR